jgi:hypothetical protein
VKQSSSKYQPGQREAARISSTKNRLIEDLLSFDRRWLLGAAATMLLAPLLLLFLCLHLAPDTAKSAVASRSPSPVATHKVTVKGMMPTVPIDGLRLSCLGAVVQLDKPSTSLPKPGEPFAWEVEVPAESTELVLEMTRAGQRWRVVQTSAQTPVLNLPVVTVPELIASGSKPFKSPFTSAQPIPASVRAETIRQIEQLQAQDDEDHKRRVQARQKK